MITILRFTHTAWLLCLFIIFSRNFTHLNYVCHIGMRIAKLGWCTITKKVNFILEQSMKAQWGSRRRHCAASRKVTGSIPDGFIVIFHWHISSSSTVVLGPTQPLTEISIRSISWRVKAAGAEGWQACDIHVTNILKSGTLRVCTESGFAFYIYLTILWLGNI